MQCFPPNNSVFKEEAKKKRRFAYGHSFTSDASSFFAPAQKKVRRRQAKNIVCEKGKKEEVCFSPSSEDDEGDVLG